MQTSNLCDLSAAPLARGSGSAQRSCPCARAGRCRRSLPAHRREQEHVRAEQHRRGSLPDRDPLECCGQAGPHRLVPRRGAPQRRGYRARVGDGRVLVLGVDAVRARQRPGAAQARTGSFSRTRFLQRLLVSVIVQPAKVPGVNAEGATALQAHLLSTATQARIRSIRYPGDQRVCWVSAGRNNRIAMLPKG